MKRKVSIGFISIVSLLLVLLMIGNYYVKQPGRSLPLYHEQYRQLELSLYAYYNTHGVVPHDDSWMTQADHLAISQAGGDIHWNGPNQTLAYTYDKPYPVNIRLPHALTFGLLPSGLESVGVTHDAKNIIHNAQIQAAAE